MLGGCSSHATASGPSGRRSPTRVWYVRTACGGNLSAPRSAVRYRLTGPTSASWGGSRSFHPSMTQPLSQVLILHAAAVFAVSVVRRLGLPATLAYLAVGLV